MVSNYTATPVVATIKANLPVASAGESLAQTGGSHTRLTDNSQEPERRKHLALLVPLNMSERSVLSGNDGLVKLPWLGCTDRVVA